MLHAEAGDANQAQVIWEKCAALGDADAMLAWSSRRSGAVTRSGSSAGFR
ncbi:hypothetical protein [Streptomyces sp. IBSBF 2390]